MFFNKFKEVMDSSDPAPDKPQNEVRPEKDTLSLFDAEELSETEEPRPMPAHTAEKTVLGPTVCLKGDLQNEADILIQGRVEGNVTSAGTVTVTGHIRGKVICGALRLESGELCGDAEVHDGVQILPSARMEGNVSAATLQLGGMLKGDVSVSGLAALTTVQACLEGDLLCGRVQIVEGARLCGGVKMTVPVAAASVQPAQTQTSPAEPAEASADDEAAAE